MNAKPSYQPGDLFVNNNTGDHYLVLAITHGFYKWMNLRNQYVSTYYIPDMDNWDAIKKIE